jgi:uncharacterized RDD family membrane protein YckC
VTGPDQAARAAALLRRLAAGAYDALILAGLLMLTSFVLIAARSGAAVPAGNPAYQAFLAAQVAAFFTGFWWRGGQTPGMRTWGIRVEAAGGGPLPLRAAALRCAGAVVSTLALGLGFWWMLVDPQGRAWHDRLSGSRVVAVAARGR